MNLRRTGASRLLIVVALVTSGLCGFALRGLWQPGPQRGRAVAPATYEGTAAHPYNVVLISVDTVRADHLSCYGYERETTPNLDLLAQDGLRFEHCVATSNWTLPTHASMFTGLYPEVHGAHFVRPEEFGRSDDDYGRLEGRLSQNYLTMAEILREAGYRTGATIGNHGYLGREFQLDQGFEHYDARRGSPPEWYRKANVITDEAMRWLTNHEFQARPFFLFVNYMDPHHPYNPPPSAVAQFAPDLSAAQLTPREEAFFREMMMEVNVSQEPLDEDRAYWVTARYDGEIAAMDGQIGRLLAYMQATGLYDETLIIVTSDHGEGLGEHLSLGHCFRMHEPALAVPLIVKLPNRSAVGVRTARTSHVDILPIVLDVLGLDRPQGLAGRTLDELDNAPPREVFATKAYDHRMRSFPRPLNQLQSVVYRDDLKFVEYPAAPPELYDLDADPLELTNLATERPEVVGDFAATLKNHRSASQRLYDLEAAFGEDGEPAAGEDLRNLGYAQ